MTGRNTQRLIEYSFEKNIPDIPLPTLDEEPPHLLDEEC
jgi:hypothetical protein